MNMIKTIVKALADTMVLCFVGFVQGLSRAFTQLFGGNTVYFMSDL